MLDDEASKHPLLAPFTKTGYALERGLIKPKSFEELAAVGHGHEQTRSGGQPTAAPTPADVAVEDEQYRPGVAEADNLDPRQSSRCASFAMQPVVAALLPWVEPLKYGVYLLPLVALIAPRARDAQPDPFWQ